MGFNLTAVVKNLLIINVIVFLGSLILGKGINEILALQHISSSGFAPYQFFSYMFGHGGWMHLISNMLGLIVFGPMLERVWGPKKFLFFYIFTGVGAALIYTGVNYFEIYQLQRGVDIYLASPTPDNFVIFINDYAREDYAKVYSFIQEFSNNPLDPVYIENSKLIAKNLVEFKEEYSSMIGASGAVLGVVAAFGLLFPNTELFLLFPPIPIKAKYLVIFYALYDVYAGIQKSPGDNVAHFAHIGGMIFAFILVQYWRYNSNKFY